MKSEMFRISVVSFSDPPVGGISGKLTIEVVLSSQIDGTTVLEACEAKQSLAEALEKLIQVYEEMTRAKVTGIQLERTEYRRVDSRTSPGTPSIKLVVEV